MFRQSTGNKTARSINSLLCAGTLVMGLGLSLPVQASEPFLGQIDTFGFNFPPRGWAHCNGQLLPISNYTALFSLLGATFGGDGRTTFGLPDLRGRTAIHPGSGPGLPAVRWGERGGAASRTLTVANLPSHTHSATLHATNARGNTATPVGGILASKPRTNIYHDDPPSVTMGAMNPASITVGNTGGGLSFDIRDPYLGIYHSIALLGIYPSRN